jgi:hypothetical protein
MHQYWALFRRILGFFYNRVVHVLDHIRCELIPKRVSGETPGGIFT